MIQFLALASGVNAHICHTEILIHQLFSCDSVIYSVAPSQYIFLCFQSFRVYEGPISSASHAPHCHMSKMDVFCISKVFDCLYGNKTIFDLTWLDWSPISLAPHLIGPQISTHAFPIPLVPIQMPPPIIGPPSHTRQNIIHVANFSLVPISF